MKMFQMLLKLMLLSKSIIELQNLASIYLISSPVPLQITSKTPTPIPPTFFHLPTLRPP